MSEPSNGAWPFQEIPEEEGLDISAIFGNSSAAPQGDPFAPPAAAQSIPPSPAPVMPEITPAVTATSQPATAPIVNVPAKAPAEAPAENPIAAAFEQKTAENTKKGLLEKPPVFYHKGVKEEIDDPSMTLEELRIRKSDDFTDLEEGKRVSWSVEYCGIRKEVKDPKGTTIISMKEMIEPSREILDAIKKKKDKYHFHKKKPGFGMGSDFFHKNFLSAHHSEVTSPKFRSLRIRQELLDEAENWNNVHLCPLMRSCKKCFLKRQSGNPEAVQGWFPWKDRLGNQML